MTKGLRVVFAAVFAMAALGFLVYKRVTRTANARPAMEALKCEALRGNTASRTLIVLPSRYVADRWFVMPVTTRGDTATFFVDTGGGGVWANKPALERWGFEPRFVGIEEGDSAFGAVRFPRFRAGSAIPAPRCAPSISGFGTRPSPEMQDADGMLGHPWFAERVWVFDYPGRTLSFYDVPPAPHAFSAHTVPMTLLAPPRKNFPRIEIVVAGDTIGTLLDTGATSWITPAAAALMGGDATVRAASFAAARVWDGWHAAHPDWRVIVEAEARMKADMIEVPILTIGGYDVGPIWFARRRDEVYANMMSPQMDRPVYASIGGAAFRSFRMTLDYPNQRVTFER